MRRGPLRVVICGSLNGSEQSAAEAALARLPADAVVRQLHGAPEHWPEAAAATDLTILLQSWPDEFPMATVRAMVSACVAGRLICCQGGWCASAARTRAAWPHAACVPVEQLATRLAVELAVLRGERPPLPLTAARDEIFAALYSDATDSLAAGQVEVRSPDRIYADELRCAVNENAPSNGRRVSLLDVDPWEPAAADRLSEFSRSTPSTPVIALCGFPRASDQDALTAAGAAACFPKLAPLTELVSVIARVVADGRPAG